ncbi:hypothetical protein NKI12_02285 [Mesorhizobium australicum]|uniref:Uncharacterized protein n=1 Tax=Mesorhizobium australicum TaxID=536018 RepID=A0ACC6SVH5_9HYPH
MCETAHRRKLVPAFHQLFANNNHLIARHMAFRHGASKNVREIYFKEGATKMVHRVTAVVIAFVFVGLSAGQAAAWGNSKTLKRTALSGKEISVYDGASVNPDCSNAGPVDLKAVSGPSHGKISIVNAKTFPHFTKSNIRWKCDFRKVDGIKVLYRSQPGFKGQDQIDLSVHTYDGVSYSVTINLKVE